MSENNQLPREGDEPTFLVVEGEPRAEQKPVAQDAPGIRLTVAQYIRARGVRQEHRGGIEWEAKTNHAGKRYTVHQWIEIHKQLLARPVR